MAAGFDFNVSCDNLSGEETDRVAFQHNVYQQVCKLLSQGMSQRVRLFMGALADFYDTPLPLTPDHFTFEGQQQELCYE